MPTSICWGITGAGYFLRETFSVMWRAVKERDLRVTTFLSSAGVEVVRIYGFWDKLPEISPGSYFQEVLAEGNEGASAPKAGRLFRGMYSALVVSPASTNTVAKVVHGIADTLVTNAVTSAQKGGVPVYIVPTDQKAGLIETTLLYRVETSECKSCGECPALAICPYSAIYLQEGLANIDLLKCRNCGLCVNACPYGAIKHGEKVKMQVRDIDVSNVKKLKRTRGITVLRHPEEIANVLLSLARLNDRC